MSTLKVLKKYLVGDGGYLLNDDNNGKTVMLSGAWGSGKTHFWLEDIKPQLIEKEQKNIYISLYGRESIHELKFEVLKEAYNLEVKDDIISKSASMLSTIAPSLGEKSLVDGFDKLNKKAKEKKAEEILKAGSIICLDDFERKSKNIDLNDLFGYISQLALGYNCKVVIILNSDVFEGEEANVFKTVKEKTVNKFFYFEPTPEELFKSIFYTKTKEKRYKYRCLRKYKTGILNAIKETEELNARIYIQVLDNCLEWIDKGHLEKEVFNLALITIFFIKHHHILGYRVSNDGQNIVFDVIKLFDNSIVRDVIHYELNDMRNDNNVENSILVSFRTSLIKKNISEREEIYLMNIFDNYKDMFFDLWKYGFKLDVHHRNNGNLLNNFVKTGILLKKDEEFK